MLQRAGSKVTRTALTRVSTRLYDTKVIDHYENPRNVGSFNAKDENVGRAQICFEFFGTNPCLGSGTGRVGAPACGDVMKVQIKVGEDGKIVTMAFSISPLDEISEDWKAFVHRIVFLFNLGLKQYQVANSFRFWTVQSRSTSLQTEVTKTTFWNKGSWWNVSQDCLKEVFLFEEKSFVRSELLSSRL